MTRQRIWTRTFATEEEADVVYDRLCAAEEHRLEFMVVQVERIDGNTIVVDFLPGGIQKLATFIESTYSPPDTTTLCTCGHPLQLHDEEDREDDDPCHVCECTGFDRADWPPREWGTEEKVDGS